MTYDHRRKVFALGQEVFIIGMTAQLPGQGKISHQALVIPFVDPIPTLNVQQLHHCFNVPVLSFFLFA